ncbi:MAG: SDR family NAD(P)-dependent oxidoreductase [Desulfobacterales bacterium]
MDLNNKNIILTGASSGIGLDLLKKLASYSCNIIAAARTINKIDAEYDNVIKYPCDISSPENIDNLFNFAVEKLGSVDIYIANAGFAYYGQIECPDWDEIDKIYRTNVFSGIYAAEKMKALHGDKPFCVAITASAMSFLSYPGYTLYSSTKAALHGFATGYRSELSKGQRLQMIYPIGTRTNFFEQAGSKTPIPWPTQTAAKVSAAILKGLIKEKNSIFPSKLFQGLNILNGFLPFIFKGIIIFENFKFHRWLKTNSKNR